MVYGSLGAAIVLLVVIVLPASLFNDFGNDYRVVKTLSKLFDTVDQLEKKEGWKAQWFLQDSQTTQVFLTKGIERLHVVYPHPGTAAAEFMEPVGDRISVKIFFRKKSLDLAVKAHRLEFMSPGSGGGMLDYESDQIKKGKMVFVRALVNGQLEAVIFRRYSIFMGGDRPVRYKKWRREHPVG